MANYSAFDILVGDTDYPVKYSGLLVQLGTDVSAVETEINDAKSPEATLTLKLDTFQVSGAPITANIDLGNIYKVINAVQPTNLTDLANKAYVDAVATMGAPLEEIPIMALGNSRSRMYFYGQL